MALAHRFHTYALTASVAALALGGCAASSGAPVAKSSKTLVKAAPTAAASAALPAVAGLRGSNDAPMAVTKDFANIAEAPTVLPAGVVTTAQSAAGGVLAGHAFNDLLRAGASPLQRDFFSSNTHGPTKVAGPLFKRGRLDDRNTGFWLATTYGNFDIDDDPDAFALQAESFGVAAGLEHRIRIGDYDKAAIGIGGGYTTTDIDPAFAGSGEVESWSVGLYAGGTSGPLRGDFAVSYTGADVESVVTDGSLLNNSAGFDGDIVTGRVELAYNLAGDARRGFVAAPLLRATGTLADFDDVSFQTGESLVDGELDQGILGAGFRVGYNAASIYRNDYRITLEAAYERVVGDESLDFLYGDTLADPLVLSPVSQVVVDQDRLHAGATASVELMNMVDLVLRYDGRIGDLVEDHRGSVRAVFRF